MVDDFGVGYASLTFVREAPIDGIKLDRRFVTGMLTDSRDAAIIASIIRLAEGLHLDVTAEGVETAEHGERLTRLHCFKQQGRHYSHPVPGIEIAALLRAPAGWSFDALHEHAAIPVAEAGRRSQREHSNHLFG